jgi:hypothetical protein
MYVIEKEKGKTSDKSQNKKSGEALHKDDFL